MQNKKIILIVEDEKSLRGALYIKLQSEGFGLIEARNGEEGLKLALTEHPDLILLDIVMPIMDGISMLKKLRSDSWGANVPVIILTNLSSLNDEQNADIKNLNPIYFFVKTNKKIEEIVDAVKEKLGVL